MIGPGDDKTRQGCLTHMLGLGFEADLHRAMTISGIGARLPPIRKAHIDPEFLSLNANVK